jgi:hypothetical protein
MERLAVRAPPALGVNFALTMQLPPGATELPQLPVSVKSELLVPTTLNPLRVKATFPVFTSITGEPALLVPTGSGPKTTLPGEGARKDPLTPVPVTGMACGLLRVLSVIVTVPEARPVIAGEKLTLTVQLVPGARLAPQLLVSVKVGLAAMPLMLNGTLLGLLILIVWAELVVPTP